MGYEEELNRLRQGLQQAQRLRGDAETKQAFYQEQQEKILARIREMGVEPKDLDQEIERLKLEMDRLLAEAAALIPWDLLEKNRSHQQG